VWRRQRKDSANSDGSDVEEGEEEGERAAGRRSDDDHSTRANGNPGAIEAERKDAEPHLPAAFSVNASGLISDDTQETPVDSTLDISHEVIHNSEPEGRTARSATGDENEKGPKSDKVRMFSARRKRGFNDFEPTEKASKSRKIGPFKTSGNNRRALKAGSKG
jgi:hypothetical protein